MDTVGTFTSGTGGFFGLNLNPTIVLDSRNGIRKAVEPLIPQTWGFYIQVAFHVKRETQ
jgi:hypothetical protein